MNYYEGTKGESVWNSLSDFKFSVIYVELIHFS